ncbi:MAG: hypothetical protein JW699_06280 [Chitinispirillaceae bacterium]|nr:hypothetical protein [Chitinispirillaceae bacterium]
MKSIRRAALPARYCLMLALVSAAAFIFLLMSCGKENKELPPAVTARLVEEKGRLHLVLRNNADSSLVICKRNFYDPIQCLDIRRTSDTTEYSTEFLFGGVQSGVIRAIITMDEFVSLDTAQELRLPVDLRPVRKDAGAGRPVLIRVFFKNIDPFACSRVDVANYDKATQNYCKLMHYVPNRRLNYWAGEVRTPYLPVNLSRYIQRHKQAVKKRSRTVVVRRSRTHPLRKKVF